MEVEAQRSAACCDLVYDVACRSGEVRLKVNGSSMLPGIRPGDLITVARCDFEQLQPGQVILYRRSGKLTAHRIIRISRDCLIARGDALADFDAPVSASEIVGRVESVLRNGRSIPLAQSLWQRAVSSMLRRSEICRRVALRWCLE
jgi:signal peptidase I